MLFWVEDGREEGVAEKELSPSELFSLWLVTFKDQAPGLFCSTGRPPVNHVSPQPWADPGIQHGGDTVPARRMSQSSVEDACNTHLPSVFCARDCSRF